MMYTKSYLTIHVHSHTFFMYHSVLVHHNHSWRCTNTHTNTEAQTHTLHTHTHPSTRAQHTQTNIEAHRHTHIKNRLLELRCRSPHPLRWCRYAVCPHINILDIENFKLINIEQMIKIFVVGNQSWSLHLPNNKINEVISHTLSHLFMIYTAELSRRLSQTQIFAPFTVE